MGKATKIRDGVGGFPTPGTLYQVDPPLAGAGYVVVFYAPAAIKTQTGRVVLLRATPNGASATGDVSPMEGTFYTSNPDADHALGFELAGKFLGDGPYEVVDPN